MTGSFTAEQQLELAGMDAGQAAAYVRLAVGGPMRAAELATSLGVTRQEAYRLLHSMIAHGFAVSDLGHPATFQASPPEEIFARALASQVARTEQISRADERVKQALAAMRQESPKSTTPTFALVRGRRDALARATTLIHGAREDLRLLSTHEATMNLADLSGIMPLVIERAQAGVHVRAILREGPLEPRLADVAAVPSVEVRAVPEDGPGIGLTIADGSSVLMSFVTDPSARMQADADVSLWSDARELVRLQATLFDALWETARPLSAPRLSIA